MLPAIDPNFVRWCDFVSDLVTVLGGSTACFVILRRLKARVEADIRKL